MNTRVVIVPRWGGDASDDWYPWILDELSRDPGPRLRVELVELPNPSAPVIDQCVAALTRALGADIEALRDTILVGHSVGCQALLRYLAELEPAPPDAPPSDDPDATLDPPAGPRQLVCVAGWWTVDEPWPSIRPWIDTAHDLPRLRANTAGGVTVLLSEDDPFTKNWRENKATWEQRLEADVRVVAGGGHFNAAQEPAVLGLIRDFI